MNKDIYKILIIENHPVVAEGIRCIVSQLEDTSCTIPTTLNNLIEFLDTDLFDLYIIDLGLHEINGFQIIEKLNKQNPAGKILVYTMHEESWIVAKLSTFNIQGAVSKNAPLEELKNAVKTIKSGSTYFSREFSDWAIYKKHYQAIRTIPTELSEREKEVLTYLSQGMSTSEIAEKMCLSSNTVHTYRKRLMDKMDTQNVAELIFKTKDIF